MTPQKKRISQLVFRSIVVGLAVGFAASAQANPLGPTVVSGSATIATSGNTMTVTNTPGAIINWQQFNIGQSEVLKFVQQSAQSSVLNRVITQNPSQILGTLQSNGRVFLINPSGIMFGQGSIVNVNGLVASTLNISDSDFLLNRFNFIGSNVSSVINKGEITTPLGGSVYLIGNSVSNEGIITSPKGEVILAAGNSVSLLNTGTPNVTVTLTAPDNQTVNLGQIVAESGQINIYGALLNQQGIISADSASLDAQGNIVLKATDTTLSGKLSATNSQGKGGNIQVLGNTVNLASTAQIDASGASGGGTVLVGGDYQGKNAAVQNAQNTNMAYGATIHADATANGNGGKVILWSDSQTDFSGAITARGGSTGGNGGFVETSGAHLTQGPQATVSTNAPYGKTGTWLIDPYDYYIASTGGNITGYALSSNLGSTNVVINTATDGTTGNGDIFVNDGVHWLSSNTLTLQAERDININHYISSQSGGLSLIAARDVTVGNVYVQTNSLNLSADGDVKLLPGGRLMTRGDQTITAIGTLSLSAATSGYMGGDVEIAAGGNQQIFANQIILTGGGSSSTDSDNTARIVHLSCLSYSSDGSCSIAGTGDQTITLTGSNALLQLTGGAGSGASSYYADQACIAAGLGANCYQSNNRALIENSLGTQTINFLNSNGSITLSGGTVGTENSVGIYNRQDEYWYNGTFVGRGPLPGEQKIFGSLGSPNITLTGGSSGGRLLYYGNDIHDHWNGAGIETDGVLQTIYANNLTLIGSPYGASTTAITGADIGIDPRDGNGTLNIVQNITVAGNLTITGGESERVAAINDPDKFQLTAPAVIYADTPLGSVTSTINVGGNLSMTGGASAYSPALIGSIDTTAATFGINVAGNTYLISGSYGSSVLLGVLSSDTYGYVDWSAYANRIMLGSVIDLQTNGAFSATTPGKLFVAGTIGGNTIGYYADDMDLAGTSTAVSRITARPYSSSQAIRIESTPTSGMLSLSPTEIDTLHVTGGTSAEIWIGSTYNPSLTVASALGSSQINGNLYLYANQIAVNAPISTDSTVNRLVFSVGSGGGYFSAPVSVANQLILITSNDGSFFQSASGSVSADTLKAKGTGSVSLDDAPNAVNKVAAELTGGFWLNSDNSLRVVSIASTSGTINGITAAHIGLVTDGTLTLDAPLTATGGSVTLDANGVAADILVNNTVTATGGGVTMTADNNITFTALGDVSANGNVVVTADMDNAGAASGKITMTDGTVINATGGTITLTSDGDVTLGSLVTSNNTTTAVTITTREGGVLDAGDAAGHLNVDADSGRLVINSVTGVGSANALETRVASLDVNNSTSGNVQILESTGIGVQRIATLLGNIVLTTTNGSIDVLAGGSGVTTTGTGTIALDANGAAADLSVNAVITNVSGNITLTADRNVSFAAAGDVTSTSGNVSVTADADDLTAAGDGTLTMADGALINAGSGTITLFADGNITLGGLLTTNSSVIAPAVAVTSVEGGIIDGGDTHTDIVARTGIVDLNAVTGIGSANALELSVRTISADNSGSGNVMLGNTADATTGAVTVTGLSTGTGNISFVQTGGQTLMVTSAITTNGDITLTNAGADLTAVTVTAGGADGDVVLTTTGAGSDIFVDSITGSGATGSITIISAALIEELMPGDLGIDLTATTISLTAVTGIGTNAAAPIEMAGTAITGSTTTGGVTIGNTSGADTTIRMEATTSGNLNYTHTGAAGTLTVERAYAGAGDVTITAAGAATNMVLGGTTLAALLPGEDVIVSIGTNNATGYALLYATEGAITDGNSTALNVTANHFEAWAKNGINLDTQVNSIVALNSTSGNIVLREADGASIYNVWNAGGTNQLSTASGTLTQATNNTGSTNTIGTGGIINYGSWNVSGGQSATSSANPRYTLISEGGMTEISMVSPRSSTMLTDPWLYLLDSSDNIIAYNDDGGVGYGAMIRTDLPAATYTVVAATFSSGVSYPYAMTIGNASANSVLVGEGPAFGTGETTSATTTTTTQPVDPCQVNPASCVATTPQTSLNTTFTRITDLEISGAVGDVTFDPTLKVAGGEITFTGAPQTTKENEITKAERDIKQAEAEVKMAKTPQAKAKAEMKKAEAEGRKAEAETKQAEAEVKQAEAEVKNAKTPVEKAKAEMKKTEAEGRRAEAEAKKAEAEAKQSEGDTKRAEAEVKAAKTPAEKARAEKRAEASKSEEQGKKAEVAAKKSEAEAKKSEAEVKQAEVEEKNAQTPVEKAKAEVKKTEAEGRKAEAESRKAEAEAKKAEVEAKQADGEAKGAKSAEKKVEAEKKGEFKKAEADAKKAEADTKKAEAESKKAEAEAKSEQSVEKKAEAEKKAESKKAEAEKKKDEETVKKTEAQKKEGEYKKAESERREAGVKSFGKIAIAAMSKDNLKAMLDNRHEFKTDTLKSALTILDRNPAAADMSACGAGESGACIQQPTPKAASASLPAPAIPQFAFLPQIQRKVAVVIGVNKYQDKTIPPLEGAVPDANAVSKMFKENMGYDVRVIHDGTKGEIVQAINKVAGDVGANDSVTIYYAGHGYEMESTKTGYWIPSDGSAKSPANWISSNDINKMLGNIKAKQVLLVSDSCFSGSLAKEQKVSAVQGSAEDILGKRSVIVMSSGGDEPVSDEGRDGHSVFAWHFMDKLKGVNKYEQGSKLYEGVKAGVTADGFPQTPQYGASVTAGHSTGGDYLFEQRK